MKIINFDTTKTQHDIKLKIKLIIMQHRAKVKG